VGIRLSVVVGCSPPTPDHAPKHALHLDRKVLFDTLRFHGGMFSEGFWCRIFERVLLPIFDAVRAEVTDTTTFSTERRRQQEDAWLYETCTRCLQVGGSMPGSWGWLGWFQGMALGHIQSTRHTCSLTSQSPPSSPSPLPPQQHLVDLFGQFYPSVRPMLPRLLSLLAGFMARSHAALAAVGVAAFARLVVSCGPSMDAATWSEVVGTLRGVIDATLPDAAGLVTPPMRGAGGSAGDMVSPTAAAAAAAGSTGGSGGGAGTPRPPYTLREGVGMRRLSRFRVHAGVVLLLVQTAGEMYARERTRMPVSGS